jgi:hypothetical protein
MPPDYSPSWFLTPSSEVSVLPSSSPSSSQESSSIYTTTTSRTIPGIGALSGKFFHIFGKTVLLALENVAIRRRLSYIQSFFPLSDENPPPDVASLYDDLLELARYVVTRLNIGETEQKLLLPHRPTMYSTDIGTKALGILCSQIRRLVL